jgi:hypothetical protein
MANSKLEYTQKQILEATDLILPELSQFIDADEDAKEIEQKLQELLAQIHPEKEVTDQEVINQIVELLTSYEHIANWLEHFLNKTRVDRGGFQPLAGSTLSTSVDEEYFCPIEGCNEYDYIFQEGEPIPTCPKHRVQMKLKV